MVSLCLKSLDNQSINIIESYFDKIEFPDIIYSQKKFKNFYNLIIHYKGTNQKRFYDILSSTLSDYIISNFEDQIINTQLKLEFFYFSSQEKSKIFNNVKDNLSSCKISEQKKRALKQAISSYVKNNKKCYLEGFINFRINKYKELLYSILEHEIHNYALQKEYYEYIHLLKEYISVKPPQATDIHLIYSDKEKILLDDSGNIITTTGQKKYLSDISFSTNDFILNSILSLMPRKIVVHLHGKEDNFIQFLKSIFEDRFSICTNCNLCSSYLSLSNKSADNEIMPPIY